MPDKIEELVRAALAAAQNKGELPAFDVADCGIERPQDTSHGEWTSTVALRSAKLAHRAPRDIATAIANKDPKKLTKSERLDFLSFLDEKGALQISKSGDRICKILGISKFTLYSDLEIIRSKISGSDGE